MFLTNTDVTKFSFSLYTQAAALNYHQQKHECCSSTSTAFSTPDVNLEHLRRCKAAVTLPNHKFTAVTQQEAGLPRLGEESCCSRSGCDASHAAGSPETPTQLLSPISTGPRHRSSEGRWVSLSITKWLAQDLF